MKNYGGAPKRSANVAALAVFVNHQDMQNEKMNDVTIEYQSDYPVHDHIADLVTVVGAADPEAQELEETIRKCHQRLRELGALEIVLELEQTSNALTNKRVDTAISLLIEGGRPLSETSLGCAARALHLCKDKRPGVNLPGLVIGRRHAR